MAAQPAASDWSQKQSRGTGVCVLGAGGAGAEIRAYGCCLPILLPIIPYLSIALGTHWVGNYKHVFKNLIEAELIYIII